MKMNAKKVLGMVLAGVLAAGSLTACGGSSTADTTAEATEAQGDKAASTEMCIRDRDKIWPRVQQKT